MNHLALFASGTGTNAQRIIDHFKNSHIADVKLIVCNKPGAGVLQIAEREKIPSFLIDKNALYQTNEVREELRHYHIDWIILAGFLWKIPENLITDFPNRIINIHPALLPLFGGKGMYGMRVHEAVIAAGEKESGITIHFVNENYDKGEMILQKTCPVTEEETPETLAQKVHQLEYAWYPATIEKLLLSER